MANLNNTSYSNNYNRNNQTGARPYNNNNNNNSFESIKLNLNIFEDKGYVQKVEEFMKQYTAQTKITTTQLRRILSAVLKVENKLKKFDNKEDIIKEIQILSAHTAYQAGRDKTVKDFIINSSLYENLKKIDSIEKYKEFIRYMEVLVSYFKYYGGKD